MKKLVFILTILIVVFNSCSKDIIDNDPKNEEPTNEEFSVRDGILSFKSASSFQKITEYIAQFSIEEREKWELEHGFLSQRRIISNIIQQEYIFDCLAEKQYAGKNLAEIDKSELHCTEYKQALTKGIIRMVEEGNEDEGWDYSVYRRPYMDFTNEEGLFAINDTLYQVTDDAVKMMITNDFSKAPLLIKATAPDEKNNITFIHHASNLKGTSPGYMERAVIDGKKKLKLTVYLACRQIVVGSNACTFEFFHDVYCESWYKNWLGSWKYETSPTDLTIDGNWTMKAYYYPQYYSGSFSRYYHYANNFKASVNPSGGSSAPFQSYFTIYSTGPNASVSGETQAYYYQPEYESCYWTAIRNGNENLRATIVR